MDQYLVVNNISFKQSHAGQAFVSDDGILFRKFPQFN